MIIILFLIVVLLLLLVLSLAVKLSIRLYSKNKDYEEVINNLGKKIKGLEKKVKERDATISQHHRNIINIQTDFSEKLDYFTRMLERKMPKYVIADRHSILHKSDFLILPVEPLVLTEKMYGMGLEGRYAIDDKKYRRETPYFATGIFSENYPLSEIKGKLAYELAKKLIDDDFVTFISARGQYGKAEIHAEINYFK